MRSCGIGSGDVFTDPERHGREVREGNVIRWEESAQVADACYDNTLGLQLSADYDRLLAQMADEVLHTIFPNRVLLSRIHEVLVLYVRDHDAGRGSLMSQASPSCSPRRTTLSAFATAMGTAGRVLP
jgi:hypothetical protein